MVSMKLTADSGAQVTACNVDKLSLLGLRWKDLLSTASGLECAHKEDTVRSLYVMKHGGDLLSREVLRQLGFLPPEFPKVGQFRPVGEAGKWIKLVLVMTMVRRL